MIAQVFGHWFARWIVLPICAVIGLGYIYNLIEYPTCTFRYKITAEVQTPDGVKTGSRIWAVSYAYNPGFGGPYQRVNTVLGDALYVDLGRGKNMFVTLTRAASGRPTTGTWDRWLPQDKETGSTNVFGIPLRVLDVKWSFGQERQVCALVTQRGANGKSFDVPLDWLPTLVTFADMKDPNTSKVIQPEKLNDAFGAGYNLNSVKIALTNDRVDQTIDNELPWLAAMKEKWSHGHTHWVDEPIIDILNFDAFRGPSTHPDGGATL